MIDKTNLYVALWGAIFGAIGSVTNGDKIAGMLYGAVSGAAVLLVLDATFADTGLDTTILYVVAALIAPSIIDWIKHTARGWLITRRES